MEPSFYCIGHTSPWILCSVIPILKKRCRQIGTDLEIVTIRRPVTKSYEEREKELAIFVYETIGWSVIW